MFEIFDISLYLFVKFPILLFFPVSYDPGILWVVISKNMNFREEKQSESIIEVRMDIHRGDKNFYAYIKN